MDRREFLAGLSTLAVAPSLLQSDIPRWSSPVFDIHYHIRQAGTADMIVAHQQGAGVTAVNLLTPYELQIEALGLHDRDPRMFPMWSVSNDVDAPRTLSLLEAALKAGARGFAELRPGVEPDRPEMHRIYALAAEHGVPVLMHLQDLPNSVGGADSRIRQMGAVLKAFPRTIFIAHASFWDHVSAAGPAQNATMMKAGGVADKLLTDYPNLFADPSSYIAYSALALDAGFTSDFLTRHQDKILFGSDCSCRDGRGDGVRANASVPQSVRGKCLARELLTIMSATTTPAVFRKLAWSNAQRLLQLPA